MAEFFSTQTSKRIYRILLNLSFLFLFSCLIKAHFHSSKSEFPWTDHSNPMSDYYKITDTDTGCKGIHRSPEKCSYVKSHEGCKPRGYIPYLQFFYCSSSPVIGYIFLPLWLLLLFYVLGDTASNYFSASLTGLSKILKLSPTLAGVSLLSLGNGAPDFFASIISFTGDGTTDIGLNSILGGAFFVSCVVFGIISISCDGKISKPSFITNVVFLLLSLSCILLIVIVREISLWGALSFISLYFLYIFLIFTYCKEENGQDGSQHLETPLFCPIDEEGPQTADQKGRFAIFVNKILCILELPLYLPRRLTIPLVSEEKWSKPFAVVSVTLAPIALALTWDFSSAKSRLVTYAIGVSIGIASGILAFCTTERFNPPRKCSILWLAEGFIMSVIWTYFLAQELISLLLSIGLILGMDQSILGLTVLAWGNSVGDLVANVTMAKKGGPDGAQLAITGSYAGPIFNTVVGLGVSLVLSAWTSFPATFVISVDHSVFVTIGFFMVALLWALVILPKRMMSTNKFLGSGLLVIYLVFLSFQLARRFGMAEIHEPPL